jgi:hypothetical protein
VIALIDSSDITSSPPVAAMIRRTPRSKRSSFFISVMYGDSFLLLSALLRPPIIELLVTCPTAEFYWLKLENVRNFSFRRLARFLKFSVPSHNLSFIKTVY